MALMQQGYQNYMAKRKLDFENITDENEPPSKRNTRSTQVSTAAAAEKEAALPDGTRLIDLDTFRKRLQSCTHCQSGPLSFYSVGDEVRHGLASTFVIIICPVCGKK
ncbi:unnamed protein product [Porites evermanni]|uniref:Uncharacterized protein n=1 Tax=Porites evermanni TaxID=104178 RepID=A0ABN8MQJ2_9CNID|nr:unnamed protein product [Porites evermanni]